MAEGLAGRIDAVLPQTQCTKCGFQGCRPYAEAIARGEAPINRCPPGGSTGIAKLAALLGRELLPLDPACGSEGPLRIARIEPGLCIGCTKCIAVCPVDAIIGAPRRMHTVASALCTGCDLCLPACPVDCITMEPPRGRAPVWTEQDAHAARTRHLRRQARLEARRDGPAPGSVTATAAPGPQADAHAAAQARRRALVEAAVQRARERLAGARN